MMPRLYSLILLLGLISCSPSIPKDALILHPQALEMRQKQMRVFETDNRLGLISVSVEALQDLGFEITNTDQELGILVAQKTADFKRQPYIPPPLPDEIRRANPPLGISTCYRANLYSSE